MSEDQLHQLLTNMRATDEMIPRSPKTDVAAQRLALGQGSAWEYLDSRHQDRVAQCEKLRQEIDEISKKLKALNGPTTFHMQWERDGYRGQPIDGKAAMRFHYQRQIRDRERLLTILGNDPATR